MTAADNHRVVTREDDGGIIDIDRIEEKIAALLDGEVVVGFSGGLCSKVLLFLCRKYSRGINCVFIDAPFSPPSDKAAVEKFIADSPPDMPPVYIISHPNLGKDILVLNTEDRDFFCKKAQADLLVKYCNDVGFDFVVDATPYEDFEFFWKDSPGFGKKYRMPFAELGIGSETIAELGKKYGITRDRESDYSLLSRFGYGIPITPERLRLVAESELFVKELIGTSPVRVRIIDEYHAVIETAGKGLKKIIENDVRNKIITYFEGLGIKSVGVSLSGYKRYHIYYLYRKNGTMG